MLAWTWIFGLAGLGLCAFWIFKCASRIYLPDALEYYHRMLIPLLASFFWAIVTLSCLLIRSDLSLEIAFWTGLGLLITDCIALYERSERYKAGGRHTGAGVIHSFDKDPEYIGPGQEVNLGRFEYFVPANHAVGFRFRLGNELLVSARLITHLKQYVPIAHLYHLVDEALDQLGQSVEYLLDNRERQQAYLEICQIVGWYNLGPIICQVQPISVTHAGENGTPITTTYI